MKKRSVSIKEVEKDYILSKLNLGRVAVCWEFLNAKIDEEVQDLVMYITNIPQTGNSKELCYAELLKWFFTTTKFIQKKG